MTPKMVANFRRSLSFPNQPSYSTKPKKTLHVRSTSLPCRSHPLIFQLKDGINELRSWASNPENRTSALVCDGLSHLKTVQESLDDLLQLPQTRESLCGHSDLVEKFLEDFLRFIDVYGIFQTLLLKLKEEQSGAQVAVRRKDDSKMPLYLKSLKKIAKEMEKLVSAVQCMAKQGFLPGPAPSTLEAGDAELISVIKDVIEVTVLVSVALFNGLSVCLACRKSSRMGFCLTNNTKKVKIMEEGIQEFQQMTLENLCGLRKKGEEELKSTSRRMHELENCIGEIEIGGEKVFRSLINTRVSLLNVLTQ